MLYCSRLQIINSNDYIKQVILQRLYVLRSPYFYFLSSIIILSQLLLPKRKAVVVLNHTSFSCFQYYTYICHCGSCCRGTAWCIVYTVYTTILWCSCTVFVRYLEVLIRLSIRASYIYSCLYSCICEVSSQHTSSCINILAKLKTRY